MTPDELIISSFWLTGIIAIGIFACKMIARLERSNYELKKKLRESDEYKRGQKEQIKNLEAKVWVLQRELLNNQN